MLDLFNVLANGDNVCVGVFGAGVPNALAQIIHYVYLGIQVVVPILLILFGMIELGKAVTSQKEDEIKKAQSSFLHKLVLAVIVFLVFTIVQFVFNFASGDLGDEGQTVWSCINSLIKGSK